MVSMTDCNAYIETPSCCFRKNPTHTQVLEDGMHMNIVLALFYIGSYSIGLHKVCLASFITLLLNSVFMCILFQDATLKLSELEAEIKKEPEAEPEPEPEAEPEPEPEPEPELSIKQREHGASVSKCLNEEEDTVLYKQLYKIVEETRKRNEKRANSLTRTPTSSSLAEATSEDEYADMPPLISMPIYTGPTLRSRRANFFDYNKLYKTCPTPTSSMEDVD